MVTKFKEEELSKIFFTSDTHFGHKNILEYCKRPFSSVEEMDKRLIENWNNVVKPDDIVFHLGDFAFCGSNRIREIRNQLNGKIILVKGNHDRHLKDSLCNELFEGTTYQLQIQLGDRSVYLNHFPFLSWGGCARKPENAVYQLFGHIHSCKSNPYFNLHRFQYDVGVDNNNYKPVSWNEVQSKIDEQCKTKNLLQKFKQWSLLTIQKIKKLLKKI